MILEGLWMAHHTASGILRQPKAVRKHVAGWYKFWKSYRRYCELAPVGQRPHVRDLYPCLDDDLAETPIEPIYYYQDAWAFERILQRQPPSHIDVGSHHKFVALLSKAVPLTMVDIRPLALHMDTVRFQRGSILEMPYPDGTLPSLSSLCVVEHIGLGRYGDPLDWQGTEKAIAELKRVLAPGGDLYLTVPLDDETRVYFNAHRAFKESHFLEMIAPLVVIDCWYINGANFERLASHGFHVGCYHLRRPLE
jgi:SAM-dependent methyltransferase